MSDATTPAYAMVQINMKNPEEFMERYAQHVMPLLARWNVEMLAGTMTPAPSKVTTAATGPRSCALPAWPRPRMVQLRRVQALQGDAPERAGRLQQPRLSRGSLGLHPRRLVVGKKPGVARATPGFVLPGGVLKRRGRGSRGRRHQPERRRRAGRR
jgi:hypothetical protein